jgi:hypothetical protein
MYHSTALLLPDGRVLVAGGGRLSTATPYLNAEIYSPGYLFKGPRPSVTAAPKALSYGGDFFVGTPDAARVASVALVRNGAVTHGVDMNQRYLPLTFTETAGGLTVQAPADSNLAPPGDYMLFVVDGNGVPSVAPFVRFAAPGEDTRPPTAPAGLAAAPTAPGVVSLQWTAATDDVRVAGYNVYRSTISGFVPAAQSLVGSSTSTAYTDAGLAAGTYYYVVRATDAAGNIGPASNEAAAAAAADTTAPTISVTAPASGATVAATVDLSANAADDVGVASVRFLVDGVQVGDVDTSAPYSIAWSSRAVANGSHTLTAVARDASGNETASGPVAFEVVNAAVPGLVAAWGFDEGAGTNANDATGNGHTGVISNAEWRPAGRFGGALLFNGVDSWVTVVDAADLRLANGMTVEAWVLPTHIDGFETVVLKERPGGLSYALYANNAESGPGVPTGWVQTQAGYDLGASGTSIVPLNNWTHLATTYDGQAVRLYVNGVLVRTVDVLGDMETSATPLRIGGNAVWGEYFSGLIDEVRVYNRALTQAEVQTDMNTAVVAPPAAAAAMLMAAPTSPAGAARISSGGDAAQGVTQSVLSPDDAGTGALTGRRIALRRLLRLADPGAVRAIAARRGH